MIKSVETSKSLLLAIFCLLFICVLDYLTPLDVAIGILYTSTILVALRESRKTILLLTVIATLLIIINYIYFNSIAAASHWVFPVNRLISIIGLWVTTTIALNYKGVQEKLLKERIEYTETLEEVLYITSHRVKNPVANIVKIVEVMGDDHISVKSLKEMIPFLGKSAEELNTVVKDMTGD